MLLSDGADNSGGIDLDTIAAIRRQRIPVHTVGFGREHPEHDVEVEDAVVPSRALPKSRLTAQVTFQSYGLSGTQGQAERPSGRQCARRAGRHAEERWRPADRIAWSSIAARRARKRSISASKPIAGDENPQNNRVTRLVTVDDRKPRILYMEGEPRWDFKFIRRALDDYNDIELFTILRTTQNKILHARRPERRSKRVSEQGFPSKAEDLFSFQGLIIGSVEANYFTPTQQQLIRDFVDRRGGGLLFTGGRATLSDGGYRRIAAGRPGADQAARHARHVPSRFFAGRTDHGRRAEHDLPPG